MNTKQPNFINLLQNVKKMTFLSVLCVTITRSYNQLVTSVFRRATFSGVFTNFKGLLPAACKFRLVYTLRYCAFSIVLRMKKIMKKLC